MGFTDVQYEMAEVAYHGYCKQTGWKSVVTGDPLPTFTTLRKEIRDAWAAGAVALANHLHLKVVSE